MDAGPEKYLPDIMPGVRMTPWRARLLICGRSGEFNYYKILKQAFPKDGYIRTADLFLTTIIILTPFTVGNRIASFINLSGRSFRGMQFTTWKQTFCRLNT
jgi:hypothetical protein